MTSKNSTEKEIIQFLRKNKGVYFKQKKIAQALKISAAAYPGFKQQLRRIAAASKIERGRKNTYRLPDRSRNVAGQISFSTKGFAFVTTQEGEEIFIGAYDTGTAFQGDTVLIEKYKKQTGPNLEGKVLKILARSAEPLYGTLKAERYRWIVIPESPAPPVVIVIPDPLPQAKTGLMVEVTNIEWDNVRQNPNGEIKQILGSPEDPRDDVPIIKRMFRVRDAFPKAVNREIADTGKSFSRREISRREDLRRETIFTIDPPSAQDFDDAVSLRKNPKGGWRLGVHIADVSHFVPAGSALDREARRRGTSIYLGNNVIPMLPPEISNDLCSLEPHKDRLALSVHMDIDPEGNLQAYHFRPSVIRSVRRFTYREVQDILDREAGDFAADLLEMRHLSQILFRRRTEAGSIDFDIPEPVFKIGEDGIPYEIKPGERLESHRLIEEFMLMANRSVAEWIVRRSQQKKRPFLYRIHESPAPEAVDGLYEILKRMGLNYRRPKRITPNNIRLILQDVEELPFRNFIEQIALRSMSKAIYAAKPLGHFGLAFRYYTHFTSPIRRYPDLVIHRLIKEYLQGESEETRRYYRRALPRIAKQATESEILAMKVEREYVKVKQIRFLADKVGQWYQGIITGVLDFGFFVEISDYLVEGLVHVRTLSDDYYQYDEANHALVGRRNRRKFRLGDRVQVMIKAVSVRHRNVDLLWGE